ncbi:unnamed protein product [Phytomonas sp. Hart1]|nr:unnamed protein product [Phytomonas sp. Hart1]|eukprot:CCW72051.1 unnamed protein product [Phytomonas sp. isolate Hart1]
MAKNNKHAKVKLFKYKTALCQYYVNNKECPFTDHCAFAHGDHELHDEENNIYRLNAIGKKRLSSFSDILETFNSPTAAFPPSLDPLKSPVTDQPSSEKASPVTPSDTSIPPPAIVKLNPGFECRALPNRSLDRTKGDAYFQQHFCLSCQREQLQVYRHNPYCVCGQMIY